jgi:hypothetical protein
LVAQTVFDAGTLFHKKRAADAAFDQAAAMYRNTVITAFQNVADALHAVQTDADTLKAAYAAERAAFKSLEIARRQLQLGAISYLGLLTAENTYQTALLALVVCAPSPRRHPASDYSNLPTTQWSRPAPPLRRRSQSRTRPEFRPPVRRARANTRPVGSRPAAEPKASPVSGEGVADNQQDNLLTPNCERVKKIWLTSDCMDRLGPS